MTRRAGAVLLAVLVGAGCARGDGRTLRPPGPGATTSTTTALAPLPVDPGSTADTVVRLTSPAFAEGGTVPERFTCDGANLSPPLAWSGLPVQTVEVAIVVTDPDASGFVHWAVAGLDPLVTGLGEGAVPEPADEAVNSGSEIGWTGPCPPAGVLHRYVFTLYALEAASGVEEGDPASSAVDKIAGQPGVTTTLSATYQRPG